MILNQTPVSDKARQLFHASNMPAIQRQSKPFNTTPDDHPWLTTYWDCRRAIGNGYQTALIGDRGTGKTQLAVELMRRSCRMELTTRYNRLMDFFESIKATFGDGAGTEASVTADYASPQMLILDEAHERTGNAWDTSLFADLIDRRYAAKKDTIIIANLEFADVGEAFGPSIMRRVSETGGVIPCTWAPVSAWAGTGATQRKDGAK